MALIGGARCWWGSVNVVLKGGVVVVVTAWRRGRWGGVDVAAVLRRHQCGQGRGGWINGCRVEAAAGVKVVAARSRQRGVAAMLRSWMVKGQQVRGVTEVEVQVRGGRCEGNDMATVLQPAPTIREMKGEKEERKKDRIIIGREDAEEVEVEESGCSRI
ncbi:hypothetical protein EDB85DRAFT_1888738 [Lactarius pseudohatsudake]|nr:hypothetical protein EDB85DRAFT_1888738 [Lactarius pseudohatsudake]